MARKKEAKDVEEKVKSPKKKTVKKTSSKTSTSKKTKEKTTTKKKTTRKPRVKKEIPVTEVNPSDNYENTINIDEAIYEIDRYAATNTVDYIQNKDLDDPDVITKVIDISEIKEEVLYTDKVSSKKYKKKLKIRKITIFILILILCLLLFILII